MSNAIIDQLRLRDTLFKRSKRSNNPDDWAEYKKARNKAVGMLKSAKRKCYVSKLENNKIIKTMPKKCGKQSNQFLD